MFGRFWHKLVSSNSTTTAQHRRCRPVLERLENREVPTVYLGSPASWMGNLPDPIPLNQMSIPGTHDTMTDAFANSGPLIAPFAQTQNMTLTQQLDAGIRYIDIRCGPTYTFTGLNTNDLGIYHALLGTGQSFDKDVLAVCADFLKAHPTETIIMSVKNDYTGSGAVNALSNDQFDSIFHNIISLLPARDWYLGNTLPTLGEARGRIVLLRRFDAGAGDANPPGIDATSWSDNATFTMPLHFPGGQSGLIEVQDQYQPADVNTKELAIHNMLQNAISTTAQPTNNNWYINYLSAAYDGNLKITPQHWAHGSDGQSGLDDQLQNVLSTMHTGRVGTIVMDFPTMPLIARVVGMNWPYVTESASSLQYGASATVTLHTIDPSRTVTFNATGGTATFGAVTHNTTGFFTTYSATVTPTSVGNLTIGAQIANQPALAPYPTLAVAADSTVLSLGGMPGAVAYGQAVTFSARVANTSGTPAVPTGTIQFVVDGKNFGQPVPVDKTGRAALTIDRPLALGTHTVTAVYTNQDGDFTGSQARAQRLHVMAAQVSVTLAGPTVMLGRSAIWTVTVAGLHDTLAPPTGTVQFSIDGHNVGVPVRLDKTGRGQLAISPALAAGRHTIRAVYVSDSTDFLGARSTVATLTVIAPAVAVPLS
jgi:1-phosphatidylinositol phosphodiesterase